ncbi:MAG TPA: phytanoyl-CoA dioxygenase family protein [Hyphomonas sp.]|mgnify:CR=1 FL=1|nr:phytanoyl-CoA dioxygenase family protein [Hyphomonas sp.]
MNRYNASDLSRWRSDGAALMPGFFTKSEIVPVLDDFGILFSGGQPQPHAAVENTKGKDVRMPSRVQFEHTRMMPFDCSPALNLLALHPALIAFAREALGTEDVRLYQSISWAKFTGQADFDQPFHMDYYNHTLTTIGDDPCQRTVNFSIYATDVTDEHGSIRYVTRGEGDEICGPMRPGMPDVSQQDALRRIERSGAGPSGTVLAYSSDIYHRATNLTAPEGRRYVLFASYKAAENDAVDFVAWPSSVPREWSRLYSADDNPWRHFFEHASPEQLACLNVPLPGDRFWTEVTLARTQTRWPRWDATAWRRAIA